MTTPKASVPSTLELWDLAPIPLIFSLVGLHSAFSDQQYLLAFSLCQVFTYLLAVSLILRNSFLSTFAASNCLTISILELSKNIFALAIVPYDLAFRLSLMYVSLIILLNLPISKTKVLTSLTVGSIITHSAIGLTVIRLAPQATAGMTVPFTYLLSDVGNLLGDNLDLSAIATSAGSYLLLYTVALAVVKKITAQKHIS